MIKLLLKSVREYRKTAIYTALLVFGEVVMQVLMPFVMTNLLENGMQAANMKYIWRMGMLLLVCMLFSVFFGVLSARESAIAGAGFARNL